MNWGNSAFCWKLIYDAVEEMFFLLIQTMDDADAEHASTGPLGAQHLEKGANAPLSHRQNFKKKKCESI